MHNCRGDRGRLRGIPYKVFRERGLPGAVTPALQADGDSRGYGASIHDNAGLQGGKIEYGIPYQRDNTDGYRDKWI